MLKSTLILFAALVGCGGSTLVEDDPLTGTWQSDSCHAPAMLSDSVQSCRTILKFTSDLKFTFNALEQSPPAAPVTPKCLTTHEVTGQTWSVSTGKFALAGNAKATVRTTECVNGSDNHSETADSTTVVPNEAYVYTISGKTLAVSSGELTGSYTKQ